MTETFASLLCDLIAEYKENTPKSDAESNTEIVAALEAALSALKTEGHEHSEEAAA